VDGPRHPFYGPFTRGSIRSSSSVSRTFVSINARASRLHSECKLIRKEKETSMFSIQFLIHYLEVSSRDYCKKKNKFVLLHTVGTVERPLWRKWKPFCILPFSFYLLKIIYLYSLRMGETNCYIMKAIYDVSECIAIVYTWGKENKQKKNKKQKKKTILMKHAWLQHRLQTISFLSFE